MIRAVQINVSLVDVLAGMPNYGKFLKELVSNKHKLEQILSAFLSDESSAMIQNKVPPKLGDPRSFLIPCNFNKAFSCDALANLGASINLMPYSLYAKLSLKTLKPTKMSVVKSFTQSRTILEEKLFAEFDEFMEMTVEENSESESNTKEPPFKKITFNTDYKIKTSLEEPPTNLELKPLPDNLEYEFLEEPSFLPVIISSQLPKQDKVKLISILKRHKQAFAWKTTNIPGIHANFYRRFIKDFSKITRPLTKFLEKDTPFEFNDECHKAFNSLKEKLTCTPVIVSPNWNLPFELMCDASDFAVGALLSQKDGKHFHPVYFENKTLNEAQQKYTATEKELMAVVFAFDKF
ncbi:reverse transcriptase domain-containing protein [Tanacetum coccineum]